MKFVGNNLSRIFFFLEFLKDHRLEEILDGYKGKTIILSSELAVSLILENILRNMISKKYISDIVALQFISRRKIKCK